MPQSNLTDSPSYLLPIEQSPRSEQVARRITDAIVSGVLPSGSRLPSESELAKQLKVATVTIREALVSLRLRGLVQTNRGREGGSTITFQPKELSNVIADRLSDWNPSDVTDARLRYYTVAGLAAEIVAENHDETLIARLTLLSSDGHFRSFDSACLAIGRFLSEIARETCSVWVLKELVSTHADLNSFIWFYLIDEANLAAAQKWQLSVVEAIKDKNPTKARAEVLTFLKNCETFAIKQKD